MPLQWTRLKTALHVLWGVVLSFGGHGLAWLSIPPTMWYRDPDISCARWSDDDAFLTYSEYLFFVQKWTDHECYSFVEYLSPSWEKVFLLARILLGPIIGGLVQFLNGLELCPTVKPSLCGTVSRNWSWSSCSPRGMCCNSLAFGAVVHHIVLWSSAFCRKDDEDTPVTSPK